MVHVVRSFNGGKEETLRGHQECARNKYGFAADFIHPDNRGDCGQEHTEVFIKFIAWGIFR